MDITAYTDIEKRLAQAKRLLEERSRGEGIGVLRATLLSHPDDPRAKEMLKGLGITYIRSMMTGHSSPVNYLLWRPDGELLVSLDSGWSVRIWETRNLTEVHSFRVPHLGMGRFSPDGRRLFLVSQYTQMQVWNTESFTLEREMEIGWSNAENGSDGMPAIYDVTDIQFSPDGKYVAFCVGSKKLRIMNAGDLSDVKSIDFENHLISSTAWSADGKYLAGTTGQGVSIWEAKDWELKYGLTDKGAVYCLAWSPDGRFIAAKADQEVAVWDFAKKRLCKTLPFGGEFTTARFGPKAIRLAVVSSNAIKIWDGPDFEWARDIPAGGQDDKLSSAAWSPDGGRLAAGYWNGTIKILDSNSLQETKSIPGRPGQSLCAWSPAGGHIALTSASGLVYLVNDKDLTTAKTLSISQYGQPRCLAWSPNGKYLACATEQDKVKIWEAPDFEKVKYIKGELERNVVASLAWSRDGNRFAYGSYGQVRIYQADNASLEKKINLRDWEIFSLDFSPDGKQLAVGSDTKYSTKIFDLDSGNEIQSLPGRLGLWSPDGKLFISASKDTKFKILDGQTLEALREIKTNYTPDKIQWSPDGKFVATTADDRLLAWEAETGKELALPQALSYRINDFCWDGGSKRIIAGNSDESAIVDLTINSA